MHKIIIWAQNFIYFHFKVYEVTGEAVSQFILQTSILIFQLIHHDIGEQLIYINGKKIECVSILTSLVAVNFGLSTHWLSNYRKASKYSDKLQLTAINLADVCLRLALTLSLAVFSMRWKYGLIVIISTQVFLLWLSPLILSFFHICNFTKRIQAVDRSLVLVPMPWALANSVEKNQIEQAKSLRIWNKVVGISVAVVVITSEVMATYGPNPLQSQDPWYLPSLKN